MTPYRSYLGWFENAELATYFGITLKKIMARYIVTLIKVLPPLALIHLQQESCK